MQMRHLHIYIIRAIKFGGKKHLNQFDSLFEPLEKEEVHYRKFGRITSGIKLQTSILSIISFVSERLPIWRDDADRVHEQSEPKLNSQLCGFLDCRAREDLPMFRFCHEEIQLGTRSIDLSVKSVEKIIIETQTYSTYDPVLVIECKRLPARSLDYEKEYVTGTQPNQKSGGIQRFKLGLHGAKHNLVAMIGYVQDCSASYWHGKINGWILELVNNPIGDGCIWAANETLNPLEEDKTKGIASYRSTHSRTLGDKIELHHLWITMNVEN